MNRNEIEGATKAAGICSALGRTNPHSIIIDRRSIIRRAAHIPFAGLQFPIDPATQAGRITELVSDCNVMPVATRLESRVGRPTMPRGSCFGAVGFRR